MCIGLMACTSDEPETSTASIGINADTTEIESVTISFDFPEVSITPMTRANISEAASRLDVWIYENDSEVEAVHQSSSSVGFGSVTLNLNKTKTYTLYAIAHKATAACELTDGIISFPDDKPKESFFYTTTFSPSITSPEASGTVFIDSISTVSATGVSRGTGALFRRIASLYSYIRLSASVVTSLSLPR